MIFPWNRKEKMPEPSINPEVVDQETVKALSNVHREGMRHRRAVRGIATSANDIRIAIDAVLMGSRRLDNGSKQ